MRVAGWWDGTGVEAEEALAARVQSEEGEALLTKLGWTRLGVLGVSQGADTVHEAVRFARVNLWRSADGTVAIEMQRNYGRAVAEIWSMLEDGQILKTIWHERGETLRPQAYAHDPGEPLPKPIPWDTVTFAERFVDLLCDPAAGYELRYASDLDLQAAIARHRAWVEELTVSRGVAQTLDLAAVGAMEGRSTEVAGSGRVAGVQPRRMLRLTVGLACLLLVFPLAEAWLAWSESSTTGLDLGVVPAGDGGPEAATPLLPLLGMMLGLSVGVLSTATGRVVRGFTVGLLVASSAYFGWVIVRTDASLAGAMLLRWDLLLYTAVGLIAGGAVGGFPRFFPAAGSVSRQRAAEVVAVYGEPRRLPVPLDGGWPLHEGVLDRLKRPPESVLDGQLARDGFVPVGARLATSSDTELAAGVFLAQDGSCVAETFSLGEHTTLVLRSVLPDGSVIETRSLPDTGQVSLAGQTLAAARETDPTYTLDGADVVTAARLARHRWLPSSRVLRVLGCPEAGVVVAHAPDAASTYALHVARTADTPVRTTTDPKMALQMGSASEHAQPFVPNDGQRVRVAWAPVAVVGFVLSMLTSLLLAVLDPGHVSMLRPILSGFFTVTVWVGGAILLVPPYRDMVAAWRAGAVPFVATVSPMALLLFVVVAFQGSHALPSFVRHSTLLGWGGVALGLVVLWGALIVNATTTMSAMLTAGPPPMPAMHPDEAPRPL